MSHSRKTGKNPGLSPNEWKILQIVWSLKSCAARDVCAVAGEQQGWAPTTVKTYLALLVKKGKLSATRVGNSYLYRPKGSVMAALRQAADSLMEKTLTGTEAPLLAYMIKNSELSPKDLAELRCVVDEASGAGDQQKEDHG